MKLFDLSILRQLLKILPDGTAKKLSIMFTLQVMISLLDVFAIFLFALTSKISLDYIQSKPSTYPEIISNSLKLSNTNLLTQITYITCLILFLFFLRTTLSILMTRGILIFLGKQSAYVSKSIVQSLFARKPKHILDQKPQEMLFAITIGIDNLTLNYLGSGVLFLSEVTFLIFVLSAIFVAQPLTGFLAVTIFGTAFYLINRSTSDKSREHATELSDLSVNYNKKFLQVLSLYRELRMRGAVANAISEVQLSRGKALELRAKLLFLPNLSKYLFEYVLILGGSIIGALQFLAGNSVVAVSALITFVAAASRILPSLIRAQSALLSMRQSEGTGRIALSYISEEGSQKSERSDQQTRQIEIEKFFPTVVLENVNFSYTEENSFKIRDISLTIEPGQFVAIVGQSGSGKSTLVDLILGILKPDSGSVTVSGMVPDDAIRRFPGDIAYVPQDITIIDGDIRVNVTLDSDTDPNEIQISEALERACFLDECINFPNQLSENVGERGTKLSGGQRQRLGIARALFTNPKLIIFDEATSSLDSLTESAVTKSIYSRSQGTTLIVIAHRLSTVKSADSVIFMHEGKVVGIGNFDELRMMVPRFDEQARLSEL
jgi:ABC-type multidrug transport system fused ATPase/permease subunit